MRNDRKVLLVIPIVQWNIILSDCGDVADIRQTYYNVNTISDLFTNVADDTIVNFVKEIDKYTKI